MGPRAIAMGGAFSSVADDATAVYWNPAGLAFVGRQEFTASYANLFGADIQDNFLAYVLPLSRRQAVGADWYHSGYGDSELDFSEDRFDISYALRLGSWLSAGIDVKYLRRGLDLDGVTVVQGSGSGFGMDAGVLAEPYPGLRLALVGQDLFDTEIEDSEGEKSVVYERNVRAATSYTWRERALLAFDVDDRYHLGCEYRPLEQLALRAGFEDDRQGGEGATYTAGLGLALGFLRFDYAYRDHPVLDSTNYFGLSFAFNFNPAEVRIERVEPEEIYSSLYKSYAQEPFGKVVLRNLRDRPLETRVSVFVRELMESPSEMDVVLRPKATQEVPLTALFSESCLERRGDRPVQVAVAASYQSRLLLRTETGAGRCIAYGPGAIDWGRGVGQAAAFVTTRDPAVEALARQASRTIAPQEQAAFGSRNIAYAAALVEALAVQGVAYVPDPNNPYATMAEIPHAVDTVHYPHETLERRAGDCDDTTVLLAALLGNLGVPTRFVDVPQHLFLLVDTDLHERHRTALALDEDLYVVDDAEVWIPLETTALSRGFTAAWREGAERYRDYAARGKLTLVDVAAAQAQYPPAQPPSATAAAAPLDTAAVQTRVAVAAGGVSAWREEYMRTHYAATREQLTTSTSALSEIARVYLLAGRYDAAREQLTRALAAEPRSASGLNNLAVVEAASGDVPAALRHCSAALDLDREDAGIWLNLGLLRYTTSDSLGAEAALAEGLARCGGLEPAAQLLGLPEGDDAARGETAQLSAAEARALLAQALRRVPAPTPQVQPAAPAPTPAPAEAKPTKPPSRTRVGGTRSGETTLARYLYWKEP